MTEANRLLAHIARAESHVHEARQAWDPTCMDACQECAEALQRAVAEMEAACACATDSPAAPESKPRLVRLRDEVDVLGRLVDAATAFCRGLELRTTTEEMASSEVEG